MLLRKTVLSVFLLLFLSSAVFAESPFVKGELLVQQTLNAANVNKILKNSGAAVIEELPQIRVKRIKVPVQNFDKVKIALAKNPNFVFVEENFIAQGMAIPDDPKFPSQWHHTKIMAPSAWELGTGSATIPLAIIDSGVDPDHPDLMAKLQPGYNFLAQNNETHDVHGHGTAVAGAAGAIANNATGVAGVAWHNPIMPLVVLDSSNWATYSNIANAIIYAVDHGAKVINVSIGGSSPSSTLENAVNYAWTKGALVFASAANNNTSTPYYPAACARAVAVAATDSADNKASFSNYGDWITLTAPGVAILTTTNGGGYGAWNGTSFSSPITAGLAALVWSANPKLTQQEVLDILKNSAEDLGASGFDVFFGHGRIDAYRAMMAALNFQTDLDSEPPSVVLTSPEDHATVAGTVSIAATAHDNVAVAKVEFRINGALFVSDTTEPFAATWDSASAPAGLYQIEARAYDDSGNASLPALAQVVVEAVVEEVVDEVIEAADSLPPMVAILSPASGVTIGEKTTISAAASDENGIIEITISIDGALVATRAKDTIAWNWNTRKLSGGSHEIRVTARDAAGNVGDQTIVVYK